MGVVERELWWRRGERERDRDREKHTIELCEEHFPKPLAGKMRGADFPQFFKLQGLKTGVSKVSRLGYDRVLGAPPYCWREGGQIILGQTLWKQQSEECLGAH